MFQRAMLTRQGNSFKTWTDFVQMRRRAKKNSGAMLMRIIYREKSLTFDRFYDNWSWRRSEWSCWKRSEGTREGERKETNN